MTYADQLRLVLFAGHIHSKRNMEAVRAWERAEQPAPAAYRGLIETWVKGLYLTKEDGRELTGR